MDVSIIIANYNGRDMLGRCLDSIKADTRGEFEVIVVDDGSTDDSCAYVKSNYPQTILLENEINQGYTKINNQGLAKATGRYVVLMNNDVEVIGDAIDVLTRFLDDRPEAGAAAAKLVYPDLSIQGSVKSLPTFSSALFGRRSPLTRWFPKNRFSRRYLIYLDQAFDREFTVGYASTAFLMVRKSVVDQVGGFDEDYFMYWADADWCYRIKNAGYEVYCVPQAVGVHHEHQGGSRSNKKSSRRSIIDFNRGAYLYYRKHHIRFWWSPRNLAAIVGLSFNAARQLLIRRLAGD